MAKTAVQMLYDKHTGAEAAALANAFNDQSHFTNTFTKIMGVTPKAYSKLFLQRGGHFFDS